MNLEKLAKKIVKNPHKVAKLRFDRLKNLLECARDLFSQEQYLLKLRNNNISRPSLIIGDIHGNLDSLQKIQQLINEINPEFIISLGDIVDRGTSQLKCLMSVVSLKIIYSNKFYWVRGNHETEEMNKSYGFYDYFVRKIGRKNQFQYVLDLYDELPYGAILNDKILCVHGGLADDIGIIQKLEQINKGTLKKDNYTSFYDATFQLLWNDPKEGLSGFKESFRGPGIYYFGEDVVDEYLKKYDLDYVIRAHECFPEGFRWFFNGKLLSIFSAANYRGANYNPASYALIKGERIIPKTFFS